MSLAALRSNLAMMAQMAAAGIAQPRMCTVSTGHPTEYQVKVFIEPDHIETNFLPVLSSFVGNGWGMFCKPVAGDQVLVLFAEGDINCGIVVGGLYSEVDRPLAAPDREFWLTHQDGALLKFHAGGVVEMAAPGGLNITAPTTTITGKLHVTDDAQFDTKVTATNDVIGGGKHLVSHAHSGVQGGSSNTGAPV
jgi:phage baseplate assembly protein V